MIDLGIDFYLFFFTDHENHNKVVRELFLRLHENGHIYEKTMLSPYCSQCDRFLPDRYVLGRCPHCGYSDARGDQCDECGKTLDPEELKDPKCRVCGASPEMRESKHLFFKLSAFRDKLLDYLKDKDYWKSNTYKFTKNWLESGLRDRPITRDIPWGIEVPLDGFEGKKIYVWFEAVMGYLSASKEWARLKGDTAMWEPFWSDKDSRHYYFIGKDNIPFHTIIWPAILMGVEGLNLPYDVPANEYMRLGKEKFSKSRGVLVDIPTVIGKYDPDSLRYYLTIIMPEHRDAEFSWDEFIRKNNDELVSTYGNFVNRVLTFAEKNFGTVPESNKMEKVDKKFLKETEQLVGKLSSDIEKCNFQNAIKNVMAIAAMGNKYLDEKGPWSQIKEDREACATTINVSLRAVKMLSIVTAPFLPFSAQRLWNMIGYEGDVHEQNWSAALEDIRAGQKFGGISPLFVKLEPKEEASTPQTKSPESPAYVKVAHVDEVRDHPNADKLYVLDVSMGEEKRTLVAGLKGHYKPEDIKGRNIAVLCNLKPAKIRKVESKGMLLAAEDESNVGLLYAEGANPGDVILGNPDLRELTISEFKELRIEVTELEGHEGRKGAALFMGDDKLLLKAGDKPIFVDKDMSPGSRIG
jgi:methionyl-tRNA synthetase